MLVGFDREELENILTCVNAVSSTNSESEYTLSSCREKLKKRIENYCEHEFVSECKECCIFYCKNCDVFKYTLQG